MVRVCEPADFEAIWSIINDGAEAYRGVVPADRIGTPYMSREHLQAEIDAGVRFWGYAQEDGLSGVMGVQPVQDVTLIRHAYVRTASQGQGIGGLLLRHLREGVRTPILIGTWADASWAIRFYERHGFQVIDREQKAALLRRYWKVPERQIETSVVLADRLPQPTA